MEHAQIVIGPEGTVLAATGELPPDLVDVRLEDCDGLSREIREAGKALLQQLRGSGDRVVSQTVALDAAGRSLQLVAIEALAIRRAAIDVRELLTSKLNVISFQASAVDVTLTVEAAADVPAVVHLDSEKIAWAVTTLVGNALRYMRSGSRRTPGATIAVRASYDRASSEVTIEVQDDGPGIPADTVTRLFRRDGLNVRGAGLALLLISEIMAAHGGRVDVRSDTNPVGHGTTIRLTFPVTIRDDSVRESRGRPLRKD
jgi:signal transduction histidine kinase